MTCGGHLSSTPIPSTTGTHPISEGTRAEKSTTAAARACTGLKGRGGKMEKRHSLIISVIRELYLQCMKSEAYGNFFSF